MDNIHFNIDKVIQGVTKATDAIRYTYGAAGGNMILEETLYPFHSIRNDGKAIVDKIKLADPLENIGANIIKEAGDKAEKDSGDGRKTTMILTEAILKGSLGQKELPMDIKRSIDECLPIIIESLNKGKRNITVEEVKAVATIAAESEEIGNLLQEIYREIGVGGIVEIDNSNLPETFYEVTEGVRLHGAKLFGLYSTTEPGKAIYKNPKILISKDKITSVDQLEPILISLSQAGINELVIYCEDIDMSVASRLAMTHMQGGFKTLLIKAPVLWKDWIYEDFAAITGAIPIDSKEGRTFKNFILGHLGTCSKIISTQEETRVIGIQSIEEHIKMINEKALTDDQQKVRLAWLQTKVAVLKVGANSESELSYKSKKAKDACHASYLALKDGVVQGGGLALLQTLEQIPNTVGGAILHQALQAPFNQIMDNFGLKMMKVEDSIIDPAIVVKNAITNAISIAGTILTAKGCIIIHKDHVETIPKVPGM